MICGLIDRTSRPATFATSRFEVVVWIAYFAASSSRRSWRGPEASTRSAAMCAPLRRPRIIASAMLPAPMNPIVCAARIDTPSGVARATFPVVITRQLVHGGTYKYFVPVPASATRG